MLNLLMTPHSGNGLISDPFHSQMRTQTAIAMCIAQEQNTRYLSPLQSVISEIADWESHLTDAASHPPSKHRDAAIDACHTALRLLDGESENT